MASFSVILGLAMAGKLARRPGGARRLRDLHQHAAIATLVAVGVHGLALLGDAWMHPSVAAIVVPFQLSYRPVATGIGIIAAYGMAVLGLSFYGRRTFGARLWRKAHRLTIAFWALAAVHALTAGTDVSTVWMQAILGGSTAVIAVLFAARVLGGGRRRPAAPATPSRSRGGPMPETVR